MIHKQFDIEVKELRDDGGQIRISTGSVDRDRDRVLPSGAHIENYMKNPVVQWGHNYFDPWATIGKTNDLTIDEKGITADFTLRPPANEHDPQNVVRLLWQGGWVNAASIGFDPTIGDGDNKTWQDNEHGGVDFTEWDLLEWSLVPIPANQEALRLAVKALSTEDKSAPITDSMTPEITLKPYPNEHACRLRDPGDFQSDSFRRTSRESDGKSYDVIMGRLTGESTMTEQAYRYPTDVWAESEARSHCTSHDGQAFEPASDEETAHEADTLKGSENSCIVATTVPVWTDSLQAVSFSHSLLSDTCKDVSETIETDAEPTETVEDDPAEELDAPTDELPDNVVDALADTLTDIAESILSELGARENE